MRALTETKEGTFHWTTKRQYIDESNKPFELNQRAYWDRKNTQQQSDINRLKSLINLR